MSKRICAFIISILFCLVSFSAYADADDFAFGTGMWLRFHHGPSTFALTPGASADVSYTVAPYFNVGAKLMSGAFFGYSTGIELSATFAPAIGPWLPEVGAAAQAVFNSTVFYYHAGTDYLSTSSPEWGAGIVIKPLRFSFGDFAISAFEAVVGTDLQHFGQVLLVDVDLFRVIVFTQGEEK